MSVNLYSGTPGSGKSTHLARDCMDFLKAGRTVICNFPLNLEVIRKENKTIFNRIFKRKINEGNYIFKYTDDLKVKYLVEYAQKYHKARKENQTLLAIDECQTLFNSRDFNRPDRMDWVYFFSQHRKLGYDVVLVTQSMRMLDRQIRGVLENEVKHRLVNNYKIGWLLPRRTFIAVTYWVGVREKLSSEFFTGNQILYDFFDSYALLGSLNKL